MPRPMLVAMTDRARLLELAARFSATAEAIVIDEAVNRNRKAPVPWRKAVLVGFDEAYTIAAGLRALANEMDAGRMKDGIDAWEEMKKARADA